MTPQGGLEPVNPETLFTPTAVEIPAFTADTPTVYVDFDTAEVRTSSRGFGYHLSSLLGEGHYPEGDE